MSRLCTRIEAPLKRLGVRQVAGGWPGGVTPPALVPPTCAARRARIVLELSAPGGQGSVLNSLVLRRDATTGCRRGQHQDSDQRERSQRSDPPFACRLHVDHSCFVGTCTKFRDAVSNVPHRAALGKTPKKSSPRACETCGRPQTKITVESVILNNGIGIVDRSAVEVTYRYARVPEKDTSRVLD